MPFGRYLCIHTDTITSLIGGRRGRTLALAHWAPRTLRQRWFLFAMVLLLCTPVDRTSARSYLSCAFVGHVQTNNILPLACSCARRLLSTRIEAAFAKLATCSITRAACIQYLVLAVPVPIIRCKNVFRKRSQGELIAGHSSHTAIRLHGHDVHGL